jgi:hypothetical protein
VRGEREKKQEKRGLSGGKIDRSRTREGSIHREIFYIHIFFSACTQGDIRLQGGPNNLRGRLEVCNGNLWGTVCDDQFGEQDAVVACRQLGLSVIGKIRIHKELVLQVENCSDVKFKVSPLYGLHTLVSKLFLLPGQL